MIRKAVVLLTLSCGFFGTATAADNPLENQLTSQYRDKVLALRHSFKSGSQEYEADGTPATTGEEGSWTLYGRILVKKITVGVDRLKIEGKRALYQFDKSGSPVQFPDDRKHPAENLKITLRLKRPLSSADEAAAVLGSVFALTPEEMVNSVPAYWQPHLAKLLGVRGPKQAGAQDAGETGAAGDAGSDKIPKFADFMDRKHFTLPRSLYSHEPEFSEAARARRYQGTVGLNVIINNTGQVGKVTIVHPAGLGLDENAVEAVRTWRFAPATHDGQPVAAALYIEVDYHLY
jgi:TonB family protein